MSFIQYEQFPSGNVGFYKLSGISNKAATAEAFMKGSVKSIIGTCPA